MNRLINYSSIGNQKFILTILIVFAHTNAGMQYPSNYDIYNLTIIQIMRIAGGAVGTFFAISTILFFNKFTIQEYERKLFGRFKSLIIPYFILSTSTYILYIIIKFIKNEEIKFTIAGTIQNILNGTHDGPLWFLRVLFFFVLIAPALYYLVKKHNFATCISIFLGLVLINAFIRPKYDGLLYWLPIFLLFSYIGIKGINFKINNYFGYIIMASLLVFLHFTGWGGENAIPVYIFRMLSPIAIILMLNSFTYKSPKFQDYAMFVYLTHIIVLSIYKSICNPLLHIPKTIIVFVTCTIIAFIAQKISPRIYSIISGGR